MLIEFRVKNFNSFRDEQVFSFVANSDTSLQQNFLDVRGFKLLKSAALYGPNASGKSNLIKAFEFFIGLIKASFSPEPGKKIKVTPFLLDENSPDSPSTFEATFLVNEVRYQYGFTLTKERILEEWLYAFPRVRSQEWFSRKYDVSKGKYEWKQGTYLKGEIESLFQKTIETALFLSVAAQWNNEQLLNIFNWFSDQCKIIFCNERILPITARLLEFSEVQDNRGKKALKQTILDIIKNADLGIENVTVGRKEVNDVKFLNDTPNEIRQMILDDISLKVNFEHRNCFTGKLHKFPIQLESAGTKRLFELAGPLLEAVANDRILFVDEIETSLHPLLTNSLLHLFNQNSKGGQIVFTSHDTTLLTSDIFRRDQIWFTEKEETGASRLYPLTDYRPRKGEALQKGYLAGRYGAVPILKEFGVNE